MGVVGRDGVLAEVRAGGGEGAGARAEDRRLLEHLPRLVPVLAAHAAGLGQARRPLPAAALGSVTSFQACVMLPSKPRLETISRPAPASGSSATTTSRPMPIRRRAAAAQRPARGAPVEQRARRRTARRSSRRGRSPADGRHRSAWPGARRPRSGRSAESAHAITAPAPSAARPSTGGAADAARHEDEPEGRPDGGGQQRGARRGQQHRHEREGERGAASARTRAPPSRRVPSHSSAGVASAAIRPTAFQ